MPELLRDVSVSERSGLTSGMDKCKVGIGICMMLMLEMNSCEQVSFPQENPEETEETVWALDSTGDGTAGAPALVADLKMHEKEFLGHSCWVAGYIVGYVERSLKNASFTADGAVQSNVLLADGPEVRDVAFCVPVELKTEKWKKALSLAHKPENLGRQVAVHGLVNTYFGVTGVRSVDGMAWLESATMPSEPKPAEPDTLSDEPADKPQEQPLEQDGAADEEPEKDTEAPDGSVEEPQEDAEEPDENAEIPDDGKLFYVNEVVLQQVTGPAVIKVGARYMIGTLPEGQGIRFVASSLQYGIGQSYRRVVEARGEADHLVTEQGVAPAVFVLEQDGGGYRFRDEVTGAYLAYDVRGDISSTSWLPLYTLSEEDLSRNYNAGFQIETGENPGQVRTAKQIKYSETDSRSCLLRYNYYGKNFKLNYLKSGFAVCLYLLK